jgi:hypothetical protein
MLKDSRIRSQSCDGKVIDVPFQGSIIQQIARNIVEHHKLWPRLCSCCVALLFRKEFFSQ